MSILSGLLSISGAHAIKGESARAEQKKYLVSAEAKQTQTAAELKNSYSAISSFVKNGYTAYRITYNTSDPVGRPLVASGAVLVPDTKTPMPLLNYNHGTIFPSQEKTAPSYLQMNNAELGIGKLFAANGYLVVMPDYIGYGSSKAAEHPYGAYDIIASSVVDMLNATKEFCADKKLSLTGKNFFSGWSEGAAITLATVLKLEATKSNFVPTASVLNAGPYYSSAFVEHILDAKESLRYMSSYVWVLQSYNRLYNINKPANYYFEEPYASRLEKNDEAYIAQDPQELFTKQFREDYKAGRDTALKHALEDNDLWNRTPTSSVVFCHGDRDEYVPLFNSEKAFTEMKAAGADVKLNVFKGQNHTSGVFNFLQAAFTEFEKKK